MLNDYIVYLVYLVLIALALVILTQLLWANNCYFPLVR